jgi:hypothetical protein
LGLEKCVLGVTVKIQALSLMLTDAALKDMKSNGLSP